MPDQQCFMSLTRKTIIDVLAPTGRGRFGNKTLEETRLAYPDAQLMDIEDAQRQIEALFITPPRQIMEDDFIFALECLPPCDWRNLGSTESFKMVERTYNNITGIYVRIGDDYWTFQDAANLPHDACVEKVQSALSKEATQ